jgi:UDP-glucose 4-epimerase
MVCSWQIWPPVQSINKVISKPLPDYSSHDGTAIRDYIHILDLATGHLQALNYLRSYHPGVRAWNLGTGKGSTVLEMIHAFSAAVGRDLPYEVAPRRPGDVLDLTSDPSLANKELGWKAKRTLEDACEDLWRWTENNPRGYRQQPPRDLLKALPSVTTQDVKLERGKKRKFTLS